MGNSPPPSPKHIELIPRDDPIDDPIDLIFDHIKQTREYKGIQQTPLDTVVYWTDCIGSDESHRCIKTTIGKVPVVAILMIFYSGGVDKIKKSFGNPVVLHVALIDMIMNETLVKAEFKF